MTDHTPTDTQFDDAAWTRAKARAAAQAEFAIHLVVYVLVCGLLVGIDLAGGTSGRTVLGLDWAFWPVGGWGIGLILHAVATLGLGQGWQQRRAAHLYEEERHHPSEPFEPPTRW